MRPLREYLAVWDGVTILLLAVIATLCWLALSDDSPVTMTITAPAPPDTVYLLVTVQGDTFPVPDGTLIRSLEEPNANSHR